MSAGGTPSIRVAAHVPDLMDRSKLSGVAKAAGREIAFVGSVDGLLAAEADLVIVDLGRPGVVGALGALCREERRVIGFGSHVDAETLDAARAAGCETHARSVFFSQVMGRLFTD